MMDTMTKEDKERKVVMCQSGSKEYGEIGREKKKGTKERPMTFEVSERCDNPSALCLCPV